jgi:hypothetical protein
MPIIIHSKLHFNSATLQELQQPNVGAVWEKCKDITNLKFTSLLNAKTQSDKESFFNNEDASAVKEAEPTE